MGVALQSFHAELEEGLKLQSQGAARRSTGLKDCIHISKDGGTILHPIQNQVGPLKEDTSSNILMSQWVAQLMCGYPEIREHTVTTSEYGKAGGCVGTPDTLKDISDASVTHLRSLCNNRKESHGSSASPSSVVLMDVIW